MLHSYLACFGALCQFSWLNALLLSCIYGWKVPWGHFLEGEILVIQQRSLLTRLGLPVLLALLCSFALMAVWGSAGPYALAASASTSSANQAFAQAAKEFSVPEALLKALSYMEGRLSMHNGSPSIDGGYGSMHLVKSKF